jgi:hypothetical protein
MKRKLTLLASALFATPAFAASYVTTIDAGTYTSAGTITFDDGGYTGPTGVSANDFQVGSGFDASRVGQIQNVVTKDPDWQTSDPAHTVYGDFTSTPTYNNANMDGSVNFFMWGYTTVGGSTFNNMTIDKAGNYYIAKNDMAFQYYDVFQYNNGVDPVQTVDTKINFQPYAVSDATGWCGSVLASDPNSLERMAGQVKFDFAFDVYFDFVPGGTPSFSSTQLVPDFVMRSYGSYEVNVTTNGGVAQVYSGSAVENNTNPVTGELDPAWQNQVSFLGAGVIPNGVWVLNDGTPDVQIVDAGTPGATWHTNSFAGYSFLLRADGTRVLTYVNPEGFSDYPPAIPEPETYAMMLAGLGLVGGMAARRRRQLGAA